ncbi:ester cyclase [Maribacter arenosus]|uniref:Ester cyclase n=1 Tax=Maribacter arenosus TaxID=1854708 RepID=A0ABR7V8E9_9FLAO|nr:ester cyclase [Maribacter arenosus]MBD0849953.1 ester cyclase [Maribacter arenosus]
MKTLSKITFSVLAIVLFVSCNQQKKEVENQAETKQKAFEEKISATNDALFAAWNTGDAAIMEANLTPDFIRKQNGEESSKNREEYIGLMKTFRTAIPDMKFTYELMDVKGNKTFSKWTAKGTNTGMFGDQPATGKPSVTHGFTILTYNDEGKAISEEAYMDQLSYLQAWGYTLTPPTIE